MSAPDRPAIAYVGDGAWGISLNELLTCAREEIGVTVVVFNNGQWGAEKKNHVDFYSRRYQAVNLKNPSWSEVARAFGCDGVTVDSLADVMREWAAAGIEWILPAPQELPPGTPAGRYTPERLKVNWVKPASLSGIMLEVFEFTGRAEHH